MLTLRITEMGNAAFDDGGDGNLIAETVRILREAADRIEADGSREQELTLRDISGNKVGTCHLQGPEIEET